MQGSTVAQPLDTARWREQVDELQAEVLRLQQKLGELHAGDYNSLRRAHNSLCQHVAALEAEAAGMVGELQAFETQFVPPELVARELGVAAAVAFGASLLHTTVKSLPLKSGGPIIIRGLWLLGGAFVLARLTGGALAHVVAMFGRNARRKRHLQRKLEAVEERIRIMSALQQWWAEKQQQQQLAGGPAVEDIGGGGGGEQEEAGEGEVEVGVGPRRVSPAASSGSSAELVEMPLAEELEAAEAGAAGGAAAAGRAPEAAALRPGGGGGGNRSDLTLQSLMAYVELGKKV